MMRQSSIRSGFALAVVLLVSMVALVAAVSTASVAALSARRVANLEQRASVALMAAESGLNTIQARSTVDAYSFDGYTSVTSWLSGRGLDSLALPTGASVTLSVERETATMVTLRSVGMSPDGSSTRAVMQDFDVAFDTVRPNLFANAALVTKTALKTTSAKSRLVGLSDDEGSWEFESTLSMSRVGDYVRYHPEVDGTRETYRVVAIDGSTGTYSLVPLIGGGDAVPAAAGDAATLLPFAVGAPLGVDADAVLPYVGPPAEMFVTNGEVFRPGETIRVSNVGDSDNIGVVGAEGWDEATGLLPVTWSGTGLQWFGDVEEGTAVRKTVLSAIAEGGCPEEDLSKLPQGCEDADDGVDLGDLWAGTFGGISQTELRDLARGVADLEAYPEYADVSVAHYDGGAWPTTVSGLTWIDGAQTQGKNNELCGSGIVVLNTGTSLEDDADSRINLTTADCSFAGILFVIGQLKLVGNLDNFSGAIFVEGPTVETNQNDETEAQGTGDKSLYNPLAIREALEAVPSIIEFEGLFGARPATWRLSQR